MVQNGILLTFTRLATVCLCFLDVRLSFLCLYLSHPPESCTYGCPFQKPSQTKAGGQRNNSILSASSPCYSTRHGPIIYGSQSTSSSVHYVHYALKHLPFPLFYSLVGSFLFPPHLAFCFHCLRLLVCPSASFYVCVESLLEFAGQGGALKEMDFSQH